MAILNRQVSIGTDDAFERYDGTFNTVSVGLFMIQNSAIGTAACAGFRFQNIPIIRGSTIITSKLEMYAYDIANDDAEFILYGNKVANANNFITEADIIGRAKTTASVTYSDFATAVGWYGGTKEIKPIIQEVVDQPLWLPNNSLVLLGIAARDDPDRKFLCRSFDFDPLLAAKLTIEYYSAVITKFGGKFGQPFGGRIST